MRQRLPVPVMPGAPAVLLHRTMKGDLVMRTQTLLAVCLVVAASLFAVSANAVMEYVVTDLGGLPAKAYGINESAQLVGQWGSHAFFWEDGVMEDLGTLGGPHYSWAYDINASGQVVGRAEVPSTACHAFLWENGVMQDLGMEWNDGGAWSWAYGINDLGQVVGYHDESMGGPPSLTAKTAFLYSDGQSTELGTMNGLHDFWDGNSQAYDINNSGQIVGGSNSDTPQHDMHAFLLEDGVWHDLGTLGGPESEASGVNASGEVVGWAHTASGCYHAFLWQDGVMQDLGTFGGSYSWARGINALGHVVGYADTASGGSHAFLWENGVMYDLNDLIPQGTGWILDAATAINDLDHIVGYGSCGGGTRAFLLTAAPGPGDVDGNGIVDGLDLTAVLAAWNTVPGDPNWNPAADLYRTGVIDGLDLTEVISNWTTGSAAPASEPAATEKAKPSKRGSRPGSVNRGKGNVRAR